MDPVLERYYRLLLAQKSDSWVLESQRSIQEIEVAASRSGTLRDGMTLARILAAHCEWRIRRPTLGMLECYEEACQELSIEPCESDLDEIFASAEGLMSSRIETANQFVHDRIVRLGTPGDWSSPIQQSANSSTADLRRRVELKKLKASSRRRQRIPGLRDQVFELISSVNSQGRQILGHPLFITTEHKVFVDLGRDLSSEEELSSSFQALGILLSQVNHEKLTEELSKVGRPIPDGAMNRLQEVLNRRHIHAESSIERLRDLGRLRSLYPAHPDNPDVVAAADRLGLPRQSDNIVEIWEHTLKILCESLKGLADALAASK